MARFFLLLMFVIVGSQAQALEKRCGWLVNPTPGNFWLEDKDGTWIIALQSSSPENENRLENLPTLKDTKTHYVRTNGFYGYGCVCLHLKVNPHSKEVIRLTGGMQFPLTHCKGIPPPQ